MILLLDIGNTRIKWACLGTTGELVNPGACDHQGLDVSSVLAANMQETGFEKVWLASVAATTVTEAVCEWFGNESVPVSQADTGMAMDDISHCYDDPRQLGVDRWLAMLAAYRQSKSCIGVVDAGSAITIDLVGETGRHLGGLIMPGAALMTAGLRQGTALDWLDVAPRPGLGTGTADAIHNGIAAALQGAVATGQAWAESISKPSTWFITGGDAGLINRLVEIPLVHREHLVLEGLAQVAVQAANRE